MNRLLKSVRLKDFLSYDPTTTETALSPRNVVIGPNGSRKSILRA
jgi:chromosome segregation ATPase